LYIGTASIEIPTTVFVSPLAMTVGFSILSAAAAGATTGAPALRMRAMAAGSRLSGWMSVIRMAVLRKIIFGRRKSSATLSQAAI